VLRPAPSKFLLVQTGDCLVGRVFNLSYAARQFLQGEIGG
jgi:hypothetical protein